LICRQGTGKRERFVRNPDGTYTSSPHLFSTLVKERDGTFTLREKDGTQRRFDTRGRLIALVDRNGNRLLFRYDTTGFLTSLTDASGRTVTFTKGANGKIETITDPAGRVFRYGYDEAGNLGSVTDPLGHTTRYVYDAQHNLVQIIDPRGHVVQQVSYEAQGRVAAFTEQEETWAISYFPEEKTTTKRDSLGHTWTYVYNNHGNIIRTIDSLGNHEEVVYTDSSSARPMPSGRSPALPMTPTGI
ncbi:MAG: RHS repeat protein, partial [Candidatus Tectomicrobia bacterium]|nr:RHS repeat protein [Candidatus Tectomicrobia bacterium]